MPESSSPVSSATRPIVLAAVGLVVALCALSAQAQQWGQYLAFEDLFSIGFPGEPAIEATTYETEFGATLPARVYKAEDIFGTYAVTAVDWRGADEQHAAAYEGCIVSTGDLRGGENPGLCSRNTLRSEVDGAMLHAMFDLIRRGGEVTYFGQMDAEEVEGLRVSIHNSDGSLTIGAAHWHENRLYIIEVTAPDGAPTPNSFPVSMGFLDEEGRRVRYEERYSPLLPTPSRSR